MRPPIRTIQAAFLFSAGLLAVTPVLAAPAVIVEGVADGTLRNEIEASLADTRTQPRSPLEARRRAIDAARDITALLRSEGFYAGVATPDVQAGPPVRSLVRVSLGPRFKLTAASIEWVGTPPSDAAAASASKVIGLPDGGPGRAGDVVAAEGRIIAALRAAGYADAEVQPRQVVVDHADSTVKPTYRIAAASLVKLGQTQVISKDRTRTRWVAGLAPWTPGAVYEPALLAKLEKRLLDTGVYESATVALGPPQAGGDGTRAVVVTLIDRPRHSLELGATYSTTEGSGGDAKYTTYNRLGRGDSLILTAKAYDIQQKLDLEQDLPHWGRAGQTLKVGGGFLGDRTAAYDDIGAGVRLEVVRKADLTNQVSLGGTLDFASTREKVADNILATPVGQDLKLVIATARVGTIIDRSNSLLDPTRGWRLEANAEPTFIGGDRTLGYVRLQTQVTGYLPLGSGLPVVAARIKLGSILGGSIPGVPADRRFFAGGGGSVRGYGYQGVGPRLVDNTPVGGLALTEGSIEFRQRLSKSWGLVAFADAGAINETSSPGVNALAIGAGIGVRYDLGFGPLRLDIATPVNSRRGDSPVQIYISIGQAF